MRERERERDYYKGQCEKERTEKNERKEGKIRKEGGRKRDWEKEMYRGRERGRKRGKRPRQAEKQAPGGWQPSVPGLAAGRWCWGVGTGRRWSPGRRAECLRDVFIP